MNVDCLQHSKQPANSSACALLDFRSLKETHRQRQLNPALTLCPLSPSCLDNEVTKHTALGVTVSTLFTLTVDNSIAGQGTALSGGQVSASDTHGYIHLPGCRLTQ